MFDLTAMTVGDLLRLYATLLEELRRRNVVRTANNPVADLAESLFCGAFGWHRADKEAKGYDAENESGVRYEIKGRRLTQHNKSRQVSAIRSFDGFGILAGVLFNHDFSILRAALVPVSIVKVRSEWVEHTNSWRFLLHDDVWKEPGVKDVTAELSRFMEALK
jgi:hypothetical protein